MALVAAFFSLGLNRYLTVDALKDGRQTLELLRSASPWTFAAGFVLAYLLVAALALPGATFLSFAAGALFGTYIGVLLVWLAAGTGATLGMLMSRFVLREPVQRWFGDKLNEVNLGFDRDGALYLFTLRLIPAFPFFLINVTMGLTTIRVATFYIVSQIAMLPGIIVYVNAGAQMRRIDYLRQVFSPGLLFSFLLIAALPWIARVLVRAARRRYAGQKNQ